MHRFHQLLTLGVVVAGVILATTPEMAEACSCIPRHPQRKFCDADWVVKGRIISTEVPEPETSSSVYFFDYDSEKMNYTFYVYRVYKGHNMRRREKITISTRPDDAACGLSFLRERHTYVLSGTGGPGSRETNYCEFYEDWSSISRNHKQGLYYHWPKFCSRCKPVSLMEENAMASKHVCLSPGSGYEETCEDQFARCKPNGRGRCVWFGGPEYEECLEQRGSSYNTQYHYGYNYQYRFY